MARKMRGGRVVGRTSVVRGRTGTARPTRVRTGAPGRMITTGGVTRFVPTPKVRGFKPTIAGGSARKASTQKAIRTVSGGDGRTARNLGVRVPTRTQVEAFFPGAPGVGDIVDITPGVPAHDLQVIDRRNVLVDVQTGRVMRAVSVRAKIQKRRRPSSRASAGLRREIDNLKQQNTMMMMMAMNRGGCR